MGQKSYLVSILKYNMYIVFNSDHSLQNANIGITERDKTQMIILDLIIDAGGQTNKLKRHAP